MLTLHASHVALADADVHTRLRAQSRTYLHLDRLRHRWASRAALGREDTVFYLRNRQRHADTIETLPHLPPTPSLGRGETLPTLPGYPPSGESEIHRGLITA